LAKTKTSFFCQSCGYESAKWLGKCPSCNSWNTFAEEILSKDDNNKTDWRQDSGRSKVIKARSLNEIQAIDEVRFSTKDDELDRVLGGGIVPGSLVLVGGEPGIGKSTLMLQVGLQLKGVRVLYVSGEESEQQIKMRAERLGISSENFYILTETNTKNIFLAVEEVHPEIVVVDSIQTLQSSQMDSSPGMIGQVRKCAGEIM
jgi:DNA repair protein RadA/Sms